MDKFTSNYINEVTPEPNPLVMNGISGHFLNKTEQYVHNIFKCIKNYPVGLTYEGFEVCTPYEEIQEVTKPKNNKRTYDTAKSNIYLVKYIFNYNGKFLLNKYIYLPYLEDDCILHLGGAMFQLIPVLSDKVITTTHDSVFIRLLRDRLMIKRAYHSILANGNRFMTHIAHCNIYRNTDVKVPKTTKALTLLAHYVFIRYGFTETFNRFLGFVPDVGQDNINDHTYPSDKYVICESTGLKPTTCMDNNYISSPIKLAIPIAKWKNETKSLVTSFFYIVDHFPDRFKVGYLDDTRMWTIYLGNIIFSGHYGENVLYTRMLDHFTSLDDYIDPIIATKLAELGYDVNELYELFAIIVLKFKEFMNNNNKKLNNVYNKNIEVLYYSLYDITSNIFKAVFRLNRLAMKKSIGNKDIIEAFNKIIKPGAIFRLSNGKIVTEIVNYTGEHKYIKLTSKVNEQETMSGASRGRGKRSVVGPSKYVSASMVEVGSILYLSKSNPSPMARLNPYVNINPVNGDIIRNPKYIELLDRLDELLD
jgi:hypothetical protein